MTEVIKGSLADALNDVSRSAQQLLADVNSPPRALRIRAGDVQVELEWQAQTGQLATVVAASETVAAPEQPAAPEPESAGLFDLNAPTVGTFYIAPEPGAAPFVAEGDLVRAGQQVGIVEAMKLMIPIEAERDGQVVAVLAANGSPVEYGDRLFTFATACNG